jgi:membrane protein implicated in regulation of membrane protease activity
MARVSSFLAFAAILVACFAGALTLSWWLACAAAAILVLVSLTEHRPTYSRYASTGNLGAQSMLLLGSTLNAATAAGAGFAVGRALAAMWIG